jgi:septal ring factor EnvC (AmiA/AmiB activator)
MAWFQRARRGAAVLVLAIALAACGSAEPLDEAAQERIDAAEAQAADALAAVDSLTERLTEMEDELGDVALDRKQVDKRLDKLSASLDAQIAALKEQLKNAKASNADAAASALAAAQQAARDLSVLEKRFNYHLKNGD